MRRGRIVTGAVLLLAAFTLTGAPSALAASPQDICADLQDGHVDGTYTNAEWDAFLHDPTIQGYGCSMPLPSVTVTPPAAPAAQPETPAPVSAPAPQPCTETTTQPNGSGGSNGNGGSNGSGGSNGNGGANGANGQNCQETLTPPVPVTAPVPQVTPSAQLPAVIQAVAAQKHTLVKAKPQTAHVAGVKSPTKSAVAPLATTRTKGTLPFTGAELALFAIVGLALIASGFVLRTTARQRQET